MFNIEGDGDIQRHFIPASMRTDNVWAIGTSLGFIPIACVRPEIGPVVTNYITDHRKWKKHNMLGYKWAVMWPL